MFEYIKRFCIVNNSYDVKIVKNLRDSDSNLHLQMYSTCRSETRYFYRYIFLMLGQIEGRPDFEISIMPNAYIL